MTVPAVRVRRVNDAPVRPGRPYVLYWMTAARRTRFNPALERAIEWCDELSRPLVVFEPLRVDYPHASLRMHSFVRDGMVDQRERFEQAGVCYLPFVESHVGEARGLLSTLARGAAAVITDDAPVFFLPRMLSAAAAKLDVTLEAVDANTLIPLQRAPRAFPTARGYRRFVHETAPDELQRSPASDPLDSYPRELPAPERPSDPRLARGIPGYVELAGLPVDASVPRAEPGGERAGRRRWRAFVERGLPGYLRRGRHPDDEATSGISPWLHFGQLSPHELFFDVARSAGWRLGAQAAKPTGNREAWWQMNEDAEAFLEQLVVWRELGMLHAHRRPVAHRTFDGLPAWARKTLADHEQDARVVYSMEQLENAETDDPIWNAAQRQLVAEGRIHNYLRMLWGKRVIEWSPSPREAMSRLIHLNDRWALDGRDPNSYSGITWVFGQYDRAWGPERPIFGKVRFMTSDSTRRKLRLRAYLERFSASSVG